MIHINKPLHQKYVDAQHLVYATATGGHNTDIIRTSLYLSDVLTQQEWLALSNADRDNMCRGIGIAGHACAYHADMPVANTSMYAENGEQGIDMDLTTCDRELGLIAGPIKWFVVARLVHYYYSNAYGTTNYWTYKAAIVGTVGLLGSGEDMEINDVNIQVGQEVILSNLRHHTTTSIGA